MLKITRVVPLSQGLPRKSAEGFSSVAGQAAAAAVAAHGRAVCGRDGAAPVRRAPPEAL